MNSSREAIYSALFNILSSAVTPLGFKTISRRTRLWTEVSENEQPAIFMHQLYEEAISQGKAPSPPNLWHLFVDVPIYVFSGPDLNTSAAPLLNAAVDKIEQLFPIGLKVQNLGLPGVVEVRINGKVEYGEGNLSGQGIAIVPIRIVAV